MLIKTLLKAGIITDRTRPSTRPMSTWKNFDGEGDRMVGDDIAEDGIRFLRELNGQPGGAYSLDRMSAAE